MNYEEYLNWLNCFASEGKRRLCFRFYSTIFWVFYFNFQEFREEFFGDAYEFMNLDEFLLKKHCFMLDEL